ncbi:UxaA family hydrolase [Gracilibacillus kekensis]|uniref:Altronate dehydratase small subunit n=1 Tax=Gracilibacillus kekensis TaxID=1027249 RepID=A0A1M7Q8W8_9BACI|nr:UxaA family hydrolase [Gracilibacillus kekensis]SHN26854.1 altronate dehydratase small subunit [Gracilibacillus kekensis]
MPNSKYNALIMHLNDNVATAVDDLAAGADAKVKIENKNQTIELINDIRFGHKFALSDINKGEEIKKYGESIGVAITDIKQGEHVHVHNIDSIRGKGAVTKNEF